MESKSAIVEKRVKSTVIRRRRTVVEPSSVESLIPSESDEGKRLPLSKEEVVSSPEEKEELKVEGKAEEKKEVSKDASKAVPPAVSVGIEEEEKDKTDRLRYAKVAKKKVGEEVDLDGMGEVTSLAQLKRLTQIDRLERVFRPSKLGRKKKIISKKGQKKTQITVSKPIKRIVEMTRSISVGELAHAMGIKASEVIKKLMAMGTMATVNLGLDFETATVMAHEYNFQVKDVSFDESKFLKDLEGPAREKLVHRPPVVTVMGHVDHGKTSLLDAIRQTNVTAGESGGITQHIGAYTVTLPKGQVTFLDTPGHEAFTAMRARGASVTDLVVLVVAADDGVMPQTLESIDHAKQAGVPVVVAINKIDRPEANIDRIKRQLSEKGLVSEEWGGDTLMVPVSATKKAGIEDLLETVLLQAEVLELKADPDKSARGIVVEARLDRSLGPVATILVREGTLKVGDELVAGCSSGRVRAMMDEHGRQVVKAPPSHAVQIMGLDGVPEASDPFHVVPDEETATQIALHRRGQKKQLAMSGLSKVSLEELYQKIQAGTVEELGIIIKADVQGSLEAVTEALSKLSTEKVKLRVIHGAVGGVNESDVLLASASGAIIMGFNVRPEIKAMGLAKEEGIDIKLYKIIYEMVQDVKLAMEGLLAPTKMEKYLGRAQVLQTFAISKLGLVAGSSVIDGKITRAANVRLLRDNIIKFEGKVASLKRFKDDAREVLKGFECGIGIEGYQDIKPNDVIEAYEIELVKTVL